MPHIKSTTRGFACPGKYFQGPGLMNSLEVYTSAYGPNVFVLIDPLLRM